MKMLAVTNMYPTERARASGVFVRQHIESVRRLGVDVDTLFVEREARGPFEYLTLPGRLGQRLRAFDADLIHVMYGGVMSFMATCWKRRPTVVSFCGTDLQPGGFSDPLRAATVRVGAACSRRAAHRADAIVVKSKVLSSLLPRDIPDEKIHLIPSGVDVSVFRPMPMEDCRKALGWNPSTRHVLFPADSGNEVKRFLVAVAAVRRLSTNGGKTELHQLRDVPQEKVPLWLNASDAIVLVSHHEGSPNCIKEALACNRPVVSVDVGDVRERIDGIDGCYIVSPDPVDIADKLRRVFESGKPIDGKPGIRGLSLDEVARRVIEVYESVLDGRRGTGGSAGAAAHRCGGVA